MLHSVSICIKGTYDYTYMSLLMQAHLSIGLLLNIQVLSREATHFVVA